MRASPMLRQPKSLWSHNPLPADCVLYLPLWSSGLRGDAFKSIDPYGRACTVTEAAQVALGRDFDGSNDLITVGDIGTNIKSLSFWMKPTTTTQSILEEVDNTGPSIGTGTMSYSSWDDCFVDGVNTDTATAAWHNVMLISTSNVNMSALRLGLVNASFYEGQIGEIAAWTVEHAVAEALYYYNRTKGRYL